MLRRTLRRLVAGLQQLVEHFDSLSQVCNSPLNTSTACRRFATARRTLRRLVAGLQQLVEHFDSLSQVCNSPSNTSTAYRKSRNYLSSDPSWPYRPILHARFLCGLCIAIDQIVIQILASTVDLRYVADSPPKRLLELLQGIRTRMVVIEIASDVGIASQQRERLGEMRNRVEDQTIGAIHLCKVGLPLSLQSEKGQIVHKSLE